MQLSCVFRSEQLPELLDPKILKVYPIVVGEELEEFISSMQRFFLITSGFLLNSKIYRQSGNPIVPRSFFYPVSELTDL